MAGPGPAEPGGEGGLQVPAGRFWGEQNQALLSVKWWEASRLWHELK